MKSVDEKDFVVTQTPVVPRSKGILSAVRIWLATQRRRMTEHETLDRLPRRFWQDAGIDACHVERKRSAKAPLIR